MNVHLVYFLSLHGKYDGDGMHSPAIGEMFHVFMFICMFVFVCLSITHK